MSLPDKLLEYILAHALRKDLGNYGILYHLFTVNLLSAIQIGGVLTEPFFLRKDTED